MTLSESLLCFVLVSGLSFTGMLLLLWAFGYWRDQKEAERNG